MADEFLLSADWVVPISGDEPVLTDHALHIADGHIRAVLPRIEAERRLAHLPHRRRPQHALIPGLVNAHTHSPMNLLKGLADDRPLMEWLQEHIWPAEQRWVSPDYVTDGSTAAAVEMMRAGVTCFNDMYFFPDRTAEVVDRVGLRAVLGLIVLDFPTVWAQDLAGYLEQARAVYDRFAGHPRVHFALAPHAPYTVSDHGLTAAAERAQHWDLPIHIHLHETAHEVAEASTKTGMRPLARLEALGLVNHRLIAVHMTQLQDAEIAQLAERGVHVIHCPESNLKLASGFCPVARLQAAGVNIGLGTDGAASNNDLDLMAEMRTAALMAKGIAQDPSVLTAHMVLTQATQGGARALGLDDRIGSLEPGKAADVVAIDLGGIETHPVYDPISHIVYASGREQVRDVWVAGRQLVADRHPLTVDVPDLLERVRQWGEAIRATD